jgi:hypothetical protein
VRIHSTIETTPAVVAGITSAPWTLADLIEAALCEEPAPPLEPKPLRPREHATTGAMRQLPTGGWLRAIDGGKTRPGVASAPGGAKLTGKAPVKPPMKQFDLFPDDPA